MKNKEKTAKQLERHFKGISNHWRIAVLLLLNDRSNLTLNEIIENLNMNMKTASEHTRRLVQAGLINKQYRGREVVHTLSPYGKIIVKFIKTFQYS